MPIHPRALGLVAVLLAGIFAPACAFETIDQRTCPTGGTQHTYANFGADFVNRYCQGCHGSAATARLGAPGDFIFDTIDQVRRHRARIYVRSAGPNDSMPPGPIDPPIAERERLAEWLACGAP